MKILPNGIAVIEGDTHISKWVEESGRLDHDQYALPIILEHINEWDWVVDGGAFIGDHTRAYKDKVKAGMVLAFEPNAEAFECLSHNCPDVTCIPFGLSDNSAPAWLDTRANAGASMVSDEVKGNWIQLIDLDSFNIVKLNFLKLDVEGCELKALKGAEKAIKRSKPKMWIEVNEYALNQQDTTSEELIRFVEKLGYDITPYPEAGIPQYDILCIPK